MSAVWFTADTHFGHRRMAEVWRPFPSIDEMDEALIEAWNGCVKRGDTVYHLGDFSFRNRIDTEKIIRRLAGDIHVIRGNHDKTLDRVKGMFASYRSYHELKVGSQRVVLFHFPIESWHQVHRGAWHLHGHCHGNLPDDGLKARMDVGVDTHALRPWHFDEIADRFAGRTWVPDDHHNGGEQ